MNVFYLLIYSVVLFATLALTSCSSEELPMTAQDEIEWHTAILKFHQDDNPSSRAGEIYTPLHDDKMMIRFMDQDESSVITGYAIYDSDTQTWQLSYNGNLTNCTNAHCEITYVGNYSSFETGTLFLSFDHKNPIFYCDEGIYCFRNNIVDLYATLNPKTCRMRFIGGSQYAFSFKGVGSYNEFNAYNSYCPEKNCYDELTGRLYRRNDEYSSVYYYIIPKNRHIRIKVDNNVYRRKKVLPTTFANGSSILIEMPELTPDDWYSDTYKTKEITISTITGGTQMLYRTRTSSKTGIEFSFDYKINKISDSSSYGLSVNVSGYDDNNNSSGYYRYTFKKDELELNQTRTLKDQFFNSRATYYQIDFDPTNIEGSLSNFTITNF